MKSILFFLLILLPGLFTGQAYTQTPAAALKAQATTMANALAKRDYNTFTLYLHPKMIAMSGGKQKMIQRLDTAQALLKQFGGTMKKITIGNPASIITYRNTQQATVPQSTEMTSPMGSIILESTLVAISADGGKTWHFLDTSVFPAKEIRKSVPELSPQLVIPDPKPPRMLQNK